MPNNLATLQPKLAQQLRDVDHGVWTSTEKDDLLTWAVAGLYPRYSRILDPSLIAQRITLVADTYWYSLPTGMLEAVSIDQLDADAKIIAPLDDQAWTQTGDPYSGTAKLFISPQIVNDLGGYVRVHGHGRYDLTTNLVTDDFVPLILARARAEAYRRVGSDRVQFSRWLERNQRQNVSVNELMEFFREAQTEERRLTATTPRTWRRPVPGRLG